MQIVLGTHHLIAFAGADTYLVTVAEQLQRLGHEVVVHALEQGEMAERARSRGLDVPEDERGLPPRCDAVLAQDSVTAYALAERYPQSPQAFVCHSEVFSIDMPPQLPGVTSAAVAMSDRVRRHLESLAHPLPVTRLRQPIDLTRFSPSGSPGPRPRRAAVIGNYLRGQRRDMLLEALADAGIECRRFGGDAPPTREPELTMAQADFVVGKGRVVLEAMACGRPAFVYDWSGSDGWVTPERYPALEADAFAGQAVGEPLQAETLRRELTAYDPAMGVANRDLAAAHHDARRHAQELVDLLRDLAPSAGAPPDAARSLAAAARRQWQAEAAAHALRVQLAAEREAAEAQVREALHAVEEIKTSRRYRLGAALTRPLDRLRGR